MTVIPRKVSEVVGPLTLDILIGALILSHNINMAVKLRAHTGESAGPAVKKSSK